MKKILTLAAFLILVLASISYGTATTYYVNSATGSDANTALQAQSASTPWATIGHAISNVSPGDIINVESGTYAENITINKSLTLQGSGAATTTISATGGTAVTITADEVGIDGFTITNPTGKNGIYAQNHSDIVITNNIITDIGSSDVSGSGTNYGIGIASTSADVNNIIIDGNNVNHIIGGNFKSANGIVVGFSTGNNLITSVFIQNNTISYIRSSILAYGSGGRGAYGILLNHSGNVTGQTVAPQIVGNTITDLEGLWSHGIGLEGNTPNALVKDNTIDGLVDYKSPGDPDGAAITFEDNPSANTVTVIQNKFSNVYVGVRNATALTVDVRGNLWEDNDPSDNIYNTSSGSVLYAPWLGRDYTNDSHSSGWLWYTDASSSITDAIDLTQFLSGDSLSVVAGTTYDSFSVVGKSDLTIFGAGVGSTVINPTATSAVNR